MTDAPLDLAAPCTQVAFGQLVGITQQAVSDLVARGILVPEQPVGAWLLAYCQRLRGQAAGRDIDGSLAKERTALAKAQREGQQIKNAIAMGEWAPIGLLGDVLALGSAAIADRLDALPGVLRKACPTLPSEVRDAISRTIASARNEWVRSTTKLIDKALDEITAPSDLDDPALLDALPPDEDDEYELDTPP